MGYKLNKPYIITICSGKGGVGKSVLAANLACILSRNSSVLLWDADMHFPNQHLLMGVEPPVRLNEVYSGNVSVQTALFSLTENLKLLADLPACGKAETFAPVVIHDVYEELLEDNSFDIIILDAPAGASYEVLQCCAISDLISIVITDEPTSLLDAYGLIKILLSYIETDKIKFLVNNVIDMEDADEISFKLNLATEKFLNLRFDFMGFVPYDRLVRQSILRQELYAESFPGSEVTKATETMADKILSFLEVGQASESLELSDD